MQDSLGTQTLQNVKCQMKTHTVILAVTPDNTPDMYYSFKARLL